jgi:CHC2 zinc finger
MNNSSELAEKIAEAKRRLPLPALMERLGLGEQAKKSARCPFHSDEHPSFSVYQGKDGFWHYNCFASCGDGDEITFLRKLRGLSLTDAMSLYLDMAGFPAQSPHKSHEYPKCPESLSVCASSVSESPCVSVYPVSKELEKELKDLAARNACMERSTARKKRWQLLRDLRAVQERIARKLTTVELVQVLDEWYWPSLPFLDPAKTRDDYLAAFLAELGKVRVPTGEGATLTKALDKVSKLFPTLLPVIPGIPNAHESWRRVLALHREMSRLCSANAYFLSCRDTAKAFPGLSHQAAYSINLALAQLGMIEIVRKGKAGVNSRKAAEFRYGSSSPSRNIAPATALAGS